MAKNKTEYHDGNVEAFINSIENERRRSDAGTVCELISAITGEPPAMYGSSMVGFGLYHYKYESGREGNFPITAFSPRKQNLVVYVMPGFSRYEGLLKKLGKHKTGKSCLYINKLADIDMKILASIIEESVAFMKKKYATGPAVF